MMTLQYGLFAIVAVALIARVSDARAPQKVVGGQTVRARGEFKYHAGLHLNGWYDCGAAIIDNRHLVTAAHCVCGRSNIQYPFNNLIVKTGETKTNVGERHRVKNIRCHNKFVNYQTHTVYDIALITLKENITFNNYQNKVELPNEPTPDGTVATLTGWGATRYMPTEYPNDLQKVSVTTMSITECKRYPKRSNVHDHLQLCTSPINGIGGCVGDSGGPLVSNGKLIGISSFTTPCGAGNPDVYSNVYGFANWIQDVASHDN